MTQAVPFRFENSFDTHKPVVEEIHAAPTYTEEELMAAKEIAFAEGVAEGRAQQAQTIDAELVKALIGFQDNLVRFVDTEAEKRRTVQHQAAELARSIAVKICITESEKYAVDRVVSCMDTLMRSLLEKPKINVNVHPDLASPLSTRVSDMIADGTLSVKVDPALSLLDCQFQWADGGAEVMLEKTLNEVDTYIKQLAE